MAIFSLLISLINIPFSAYGALPITIIKNCYDGDTCTTIDGEKIRLACIDTPELKGKKADPIAAKEARDFLNNLVSNNRNKMINNTAGNFFKVFVDIRIL